MPRRHSGVTVWHTRLHEILLIQRVDDHTVRVSGPNARRMLAGQSRRPRAFGIRDTRSIPPSVVRPLSNDVLPPAYPPMKRSDTQLFFGIGALLLASAAALLVLVVSALRSGVLDARPKHAPASEAEWIVAAQEPFWFYGILALLALLAGYMLVLGARMILHGRSKR